MAEGITGQAIHQLYVENTPLRALAWDELSTVSQDAYALLAEKLNAAYLTPLQGEFQRAFVVASGAEELKCQNDMLKALLTSCCVFIEKTPFMDREAWLTESLELFRSVEQLLSVEQKEG